jgi:hypothetical protein
MPSATLATCDAATMTALAVTETIAFMRALRPRSVGVLTGCTKTKDKTPMPAEQLYLGQNHVRVMRGVLAARRAGLSVDVSIVSALHGVVCGTEVIEPYDATFSGLCKKDLKVRGMSRQIPMSVHSLLRSGAYDLQIVALGDDYRIASGLIVRDLTTPTVVLTSATHARNFAINPNPKLRVIGLGAAEATRYGAPLISLKGQLVHHLLAALAQEVV